MALKVLTTDLSCLRIIVDGDDAVDWENPDTDYDKYRDTMDEANLVFVDGAKPTRFVCNFELPGKDAAALKNAMLSAKDESGQPAFAFGSYSAEITRRCLKGIEQPEALTQAERIHFRTDKDGFVHPETMKTLEKMRVTGAILSWFGTWTGKSNKGQAKN